MTTHKNQSDLRRFLTFIQPERRQFYKLVGYSLCSNGLVTAMPFMMGIAIDNLLGLIKAQGIADLSVASLQEVLLVPVWVIFGLGSVSALLIYVERRMMASLSETITLRLRKEVTKKFKALPLSFFDTHQVGDILSRTTNDINRLAEVLLTGVTQLFASLVNIVFGIAMLVYINRPLTLIVLALLVATSLVTTWVATQNYHLAANSQAELGKLNNQLEEFFSGNLEIKTFNQQTETARVIEATNRRQSQAFQQSQFFDFAIYPAIRFLNQLAFMLSALVGAGLVIQGRMTIGVIQAYLQYVNQISEPITTFSYVINGIQGALASFNRVLVILDEPEEVPEQAELATVEKSKGEIIFESVSFGYSPANILLQAVSFVAEPQKMVAIVGPTGAGKTTLVHLLMRFYEINAGRITFDGIDITALSRQDLRRLFGMVLQTTWLFEGTVAANIAYGKREASREEIIAAAKVAQCDHFIRTLPQGYDTIISSESGALSQGQQQLLTIARVILANPPVVILDEATSSVDTRTEAEVQAAMSVVTEGRTSFVIAHRLTTIEQADLILVMAEGRIVEQGNHLELLAKQGLYATLHRSQFQS